MAKTCQNETRTATKKNNNVKNLTTSKPDKAHAVDISSSGAASLSKSKNKLSSKDSENCVVGNSDGEHGDRGKKNRKRKHSSSGDGVISTTEQGSSTKITTSGEEKKHKKHKMTTVDSSDNKTSNNAETSENVTSTENVKKPKREKKKHDRSSAQKSDSDKSTSLSPNLKSSNKSPSKKSKKLKKKKDKTKKAAAKENTTDSLDSTSEVKEKSSGTAEFYAIQYLRKWKTDRTGWSFQKVRQVWLLQHMYDDAKLSDEDFATLLEYMENLKGRARQSTVEEAEKMMRDSEDGDDDNDDAVAIKDASKKATLSAVELDRLRQVLQILS